MKELRMTEEGPKKVKKMCKVAFVVCLGVFLLMLPRVVGTAVQAMMIVGGVMLWLSLPEVLGHCLSYAVSQWGLYGEIDMTFRGLRLVVWFESQRRCFGDDVRLGGEDEEEEEASSSAPEEERPRTCLRRQISCCPFEEDMPVCELMKRLSKAIYRVCHRWLELKRLRIEIRAASVSFGNPKNSSRWCRDHLCVATDLNVDLAMTLGDLKRSLSSFFTVWSPRPRHAYKDEKTKTFRNSRMLGILNIERFEMCDGEVAFEQCDGRLNVAAISERLARAEIHAKKDCEPANIFKREDRKLNRLGIEVLAARDLSMRNNARPSTYARVSIRAQQRRSRTIMKHGSPVFAYVGEPMFATDPSSVVHVCVMEESYLGDSIVGQWATTLKRLIVDPSNADGGRGLRVDHDDNEGFVEWRGWLPLRDSKWRRFEDVPKYEAPRHTVDLSTDFPREEADLVKAASAATTVSHGDHASDHGDQRDPPSPGYPAILVRLRWYHDPTLAHDFDENRALSALEQMTFNSHETFLRCGNTDLVRGMLATFPLWFDVRGGFKIHGQATAHVRDIFLGGQGELERRRRKRPEGVLEDSDWRAVKKKAITLKHLHVTFPRTKGDPGVVMTQSSSENASSSDEDASTELSSRRPSHRWSLDALRGILRTTAANNRSSIDEDENDEESVPEKRGLLTLDGATHTLYKGIIDRILASGKVATSIAEVFSALSYGALSTSKGKPVVEEGAAAEAVAAAARAATVKKSPVAIAAKKKLDDPLVASSIEEQQQRQSNHIAMTKNPRTKLKSRAARVPFKKGFFRFHGTRSDRQFALLVGYHEPSHKRMDARTVEDLSKPVKACGVLMKTSRPPGVVGHRRWKPYRCVLRGATLFYFEISAASGPASQRRCNHDKIIDLHRIVADVPFAIQSDDENDVCEEETKSPEEGSDAQLRQVSPLVVAPSVTSSSEGIREVTTQRRRRSSTSLLVKIQKGRSKDEIFLGTRLDSGAIHHTYLRLAPEHTALHPHSIKPIEADAWDEEALETLRNNSSSLEEWHSAIVEAVCAERARARAEIAKIEAEYRQRQERVMMSSFPSERDPEKGYLDLTRRHDPKKIVEDVASVLKTTLTPKGFGLSRWLFRKLSSRRSHDGQKLEDDGESEAEEEEEEVEAEEADVEDFEEEEPDDDVEDGDEERKDDVSSEDGRRRPLDRGMSSIDDRASLTKADDAYKLFEDGSTVNLLAERRLLSNHAPPKRFAAINGAWELSKRGIDLDTLLASEGVSFGSRVLMTASTATLWISVDEVRATIHVQESLVAHHFAGPLNTPVRVRKFAGRETSPYVIDTATLSEDGTVLKLVQASPVHGSALLTIEWRVVKPKKGAAARLERRLTRGSLETPTGKKKTSRRRRLFKHTQVFDDYRRATPDRAIKIELAAAN